MKASLVIDYHLNNKIFDLSDKNVNRDNYAYSIWLLKEKLKARGIDLSTCDINCPSESDYVIYFDLPQKSEIVPHPNSYLFLFESEVIKPFSWDKSKHISFKKIFTWHDELVDKKRYFKFNYSHLFPVDNKIFEGYINNFDNKKLCALISGNKIVNHELELYSERVKIIRWFEKNAPNDFDLYGMGWKEYATSNRYLRFLLSKVSKLSRVLAPKYPSYQGTVDSKLKTLENYKFAICYENAQKLPGYITEKIFDCLFAGCIPVYWGAPNITDNIPENCFIDRRNFKTNKELYSYIKNMDKAEHRNILLNISNFIFSKKSDNFKAENFVDTFIKYAIGDQAIKYTINKTVE